MAINPAAINDTLLPLVASVQRLLSESQGPGMKTVVPPPQKTAEANSAEFAQRVVQRFLATQGDALKRGVDPSNVSDALLKLLLEEDSHRRLAKSQWGELRNVVRQASVRLGAALDELYQTVKTLGMGYRPSVVELGDSLADLVKKSGAASPLSQQVIEQLLSRGVLTLWQAALLRVWMARRKKATSEFPNEEDLEALFLDPEVIAELAASGDGPWDAYVAQAAALRAHRHLGDAFSDLDPK